jgi:hypothetical protein
MKITPTRLQGVMVVETPPLTDDRGAFTRLFCNSELASIVGQRRIVQIICRSAPRPGSRFAGALAKVSRYLCRQPAHHMKVPT